MKPQTSGPWRKTLRAEKKGAEGPRVLRSPEPQPIRRGSTWHRRHEWMPADVRRAVYAERVTS